MIFLKLVNKEIIKCTNLKKEKIFTCIVKDGLKVCGTIDPTAGGRRGFREAERDSFRYQNKKAKHDKIFTAL